MRPESKPISNRLLCQECGGRCCQGGPGIWVDPARFFDLFFGGEQLPHEELRERLFPIGLFLWEMNGVSIPAPGSTSAGCGFLGVDGCRFSVAERPCQCLALIPNRATLEQSEGSLCTLPKRFRRKVARENWRRYWQTV